MDDKIHEILFRYAVRNCLSNMFRYFCLDYKNSKHIVSQDFKDIVVIASQTGAFYGCYAIFDAKVDTFLEKYLIELDEYDYTALSYYALVDLFFKEKYIPTYSQSDPNYRADLLYIENVTPFVKAKLVDTKFVREEIKKKLISDIEDLIGDYDPLGIDDPDEYLGLELLISTRINYIDGSFLDY